MAASLGRSFSPGKFLVNQQSGDMTKRTCHLFFFFSFNCDAIHSRVHYKVLEWGLTLVRGFQRHLAVGSGDDLGIKVMEN